jgi:hypothetical protein
VVTIRACFPIHVCEHGRYDVRCEKAVSIGEEAGCCHDVDALFEAIGLDEIQNQLSDLLLILYSNVNSRLGLTGNEYVYLALLQVIERLIILIAAPKYLPEEVHENRPVRDSCVATSS